MIPGKVMPPESPPATEAGTEISGNSIRSVGFVDLFKSLRERGSLKKMSLERFLHKKRKKKRKDIFFKGKEENCFVGR